MGIGQALVLAAGSMRTGRLRCILTTAGIVIGVASVIVLVGLGNGVQTRFHDSFGGLSNSITVYKSGTTDPVHQVESLRESDVHALRRDGGPAIAAVTPLRSGSAMVRYDSKVVRVSAAGTTPDYMTFRDKTLQVGRVFTEAENASKARVVVLGAMAVKYLFADDAQAAIGARVQIGRLRYEVVGTLVSTGDSADNIALVPLSSARSLFAGADTLSSIGIEAAGVEQVPGAMQRVTAILDGEHGITMPGARDYQASALANQVESVRGFIRVFTLFTLVIAGIALFVGALGLANIMLVTVTERTAEIGIRKAVGARRSAILTQFLIEAVVLAGLGGLLGVGVGIGLTLLGADLVPRHIPELGVPEVSLPAVLLAFGVSLVIGLASGGYPALRAARMHPMDALRH
ncbi:ABC transporter permease [Pseudonocardia spinosispora]|uniref:ABC transporter permease n=1 Tax=Pseudonocardia spinosispora TaxID=103441 RepID=UPI000414BA90|nr:ABC transporter permease [Pseudonocardia spinosispora]